ncbi:Embryonic flower 1-like protein [Cereibacter sphaeroides KD131]|nr:Embryonic flower 1-like protein [Cereibacter sphaeroides KD131]
MLQAECRMMDHFASRLCGIEGQGQHIFRRDGSHDQPRIAPEAEPAIVSWIANENGSLEGRPQSQDCGGHQGAPDPSAVSGRQDRERPDQAPAILRPDPGSGCGEITNHPAIVFRHE